MVPFVASGRSLIESRSLSTLQGLVQGVFPVLNRLFRGFSAISKMIRPLVGSFVCNLRTVAGLKSAFTDSQKSNFAWASQISQFALVETKEHLSASVIRGTITRSMEEHEAKKFSVADGRVPLSFVQQMDQRQDAVLEQIDALAKKIESVIEKYGKASAGESSSLGLHDKDATEARREIEV